MKNHNICLLIALVTLIHSVAVGQGATQPPTLRVEGEVSQPLTLQSSDLAKINRIQVRATDHDGKEHGFSGFAVADILQKAGATMGSQLRGKNMNKYLLVRSKDGYQTVFSLAELDSSFTDHLILLADQEDGHPLPADKGPFRIIVPGEKKHARWTWGVTTFIVRSAKE
ncbi:MAG TPA: molybdopterin-dependent oxidoreductase [Puia sp.]|nr:molybdopterin-dependent oxidoreductase [Puia sp.]